MIHSLSTVNLTSTTHKIRFSGADTTDRWLVRMWERLQKCIIIKAGNQRATFFVFLFSSFLLSRCCLHASKIAKFQVPTCFHFFWPHFASLVCFSLTHVFILFVVKYFSFLSIVLLIHRRANTESDSRLVFDLRWYLKFWNLFGWRGRAVSRWWWWKMEVEKKKEKSRCRSSWTSKLKWKSAKLRTLVVSWTFVEVSQ